MSFDWLALALLALLCAVGFVAIFFTTIGTLIILVGAVLYAILTQFTHVSLTTVFLLTAVYLCGEVVEYVVAIGTVKRFGATTPAAFGALVGGLAGAVLGVGFFGVGAVAGMLAGLFAGAFLVELLVTRGLRRSVRAGVAGLISRVAVIASKALIALAMYAILGAALIRR